MDLFYFSSFLFIVVLIKGLFNEYWVVYTLAAFLNLSKLFLIILNKTLSFEYFLLDIIIRCLDLSIELYYKFISTFCSDLVPKLEILD